MKLIDEILQQLQTIGSDPHRNGKGWVAFCPAHDDRQSSLLIRQADDGLPLLECAAGCSLDSIINAISASQTPASSPGTAVHPRNEAGAAPKTRARSRETYGLNDLYHARKIIKLHGHDIHYCQKLGGFLVWNGMQWIKDETGNVWRWAIHTAWVTYREATNTAPADERLQVKKWVARAERRKSIEDALKQLQAQPETIAAHDDFDLDPWLFNVINGTINLQTGELLKHRKEDLITRIAPVEYDPTSAPPRLWERFLAEIFDGNRELINFIQRACGYALTGLVGEQKLFFLHGSGANGKTTFLKTLMSVMGDYARPLASDLLLAHDKDSHPTGLADLRGCRLAVTTEVEFGKFLAEASVKKLTGGDRLSARHMRQDYFDFEPTHKIFMCGNHLPIIRGTDSAIWRRINLIPFSVTIPDERQDKELPEKLKAETKGILNWLVAGCLEWQKKNLAEPADVIAATCSYRSDMDVLGDFLGDRCLLAPDACVKSADLNHSYKAWCEKNGERPISPRALGLHLKERGFKQERTNSARTWRGLCLKQKD